MSINPDLGKQSVGHYWGYDEQLSSAAERCGGELITLGHLAVGRIRPGRVLPVFSQGSATEQPFCGGSFEGELTGALAAVEKAQESVPTIVAMYMGARWHIPSFVRTAAKFANREWAFAINLFHAHEEFLRADYHPLNACPRTAEVLSATRDARRSLHVHVFADSRRLQGAIARWAEEDVPLWPMLSGSALSDVLPAEMVEADAESPLRVYAPGIPSLAKGYDLVGKLARERSVQDRATYSLVARHVSDRAAPKRLRRDSRCLAEKEATLVPIMDEQGYISSLKTSDIVLLPYRYFPFASRTSGVFSDALALGKPIVATRGTWAGDNLVSRGVGETFRDGDVVDLNRAVLLVCRHFEHYSSLARASAENWRKASVPENVLHVLLGLLDRGVSPGSVTRSQWLNMEEQLTKLAQSPGDAIPSECRVERRLDPSRVLSPVLRIVRSSEGVRSMARRVYPWIPISLQRVIDEAVRRSPS